jgi:hypothetical protein
LYSYGVGLAESFAVNFAKESEVVES